MPERRSIAPANEQAANRCGDGQQEREADDEGGSQAQADQDAAPRGRTRCWKTGPRPSRCRRSIASSSSTSYRRSTRGSPPSRKAIAAIANNPRTGDVRQHHRGNGALGPISLDRAPHRVLQPGRPPTPTRRSRPSSGRWRRALPSMACASTRIPHAVCRASMPCSRSARSSSCPEEQERVLERYHRAFVKSGAGLEPKAKKRMAAIAARMSSAWHALQPEPAGRRAGLRAGARRREGPGLPAGSGARRGGAYGERARPQGQARHHPFALQHRAVPAVFGSGAICARRHSTPGSCAAPTAARPTTARS